MAGSDEKLGTEDWLVEALDTLLAEGVDGVRVERLARSLGVTKGSFYWHFKDRQDLLEQLLDYWEQELTEATATHVASLAGDAADRLLALVTLILQEDLNRYDPAMRAWAAVDPRAHAVVRRVDETRLALVRELFLEMGFNPDEADLRGRVSYYVAIGEQGFSGERSLETRLAFRQQLHRFLTDLSSSESRVRRRA